MRRQIADCGARRKRFTHSGEVQCVSDPKAHPITSRHDWCEDELRDVEGEEEGEERVRVDIERVGPWRGERVGINDTA